MGEMRLRLLVSCFCCSLLFPFLSFFLSKSAPKCIFHFPLIINHHHLNHQSSSLLRFGRQRNMIIVQVLTSGDNIARFRLSHADAIFEPKPIGMVAIRGMNSVSLWREWPPARNDGITHSLQQSSCYWWCYPSLSTIDSGASKQQDSIGITPFRHLCGNDFTFLEDRTTSFLLWWHVVVPLHVLLMLLDGTLSGSFTHVIYLFRYIFYSNNPTCTPWITY